MEFKFEEEKQQDTTCHNSACSNTERLESILDEIKKDLKIEIKKEEGLCSILSRLSDASYLLFENESRKIRKEYIPEICKIVDLGKPDINGEVILIALFKSHYSAPTAYQIFLEHCSDPNPINAVGETPLYLSVMNQRYEWVELLIKYKASPAILPLSGPGFITMLLQNNSNPEYYVTLIDYIFAYHEANCEINKDRLVEDIYKAMRHIIKKCYNRVDGGLHKYSEEVKPLLDLLLQKYISYNGEINKADDKSHTLLFYALLANEPNLVKKFVQHGAFLNEKERNSPAQLMLEVMLDENRQADIDNLLQMLNAKPIEINESRIAIDYLKRIIKTSEQFNSIFGRLMEELNEYGFPNLFRHKRLPLTGMYYNTKGSLTTWGEMLHWMTQLKFMNSFLFDTTPGNRVNDEVRMQTHQSINDKSCTIDSFLNEGWQAFKLLGRTILLAHPTNSTCLAIKIQKKGEDIAKLFEQYFMVKMMIDLQDKNIIESEVPKPRFVTCLKNAKNGINDLSQFSEVEKSELFNTINMLDDDSCYAYVYETKNSHYFSYLHDANYTDQEFISAAKKSFADLLIYLFKYNIVFHQIADIFHTQEREGRLDKGRYKSFIATIWSKDCGGINGWEKAVEYANLRYSGLADEGDCLRGINIGNFNSNDFINDYFNEFEEYNPAFLFNFVAEYMLTMELIAGYRAKKQCQQNPLLQNDDQWNSVGLHLRDIFIYGFAKVCDLPESFIAERFDLTFDWKQYGRQMGYWMSNSYIQDVKNGFIKDGLYNTLTKIKFSETLKNSFDDTRVYSDIRKNLGTYNGINPIKAGEGIRYFAIALLNVFLFAKPKMLSLDQKREDDDNGYKKSFI